VARAKNGEEAVEFTLENEPDVLLLDLLMPKLNGLEVFKKIMNVYPLPIIILSSISPKTLDSSIQALLLGAFDYVIKPGTLGGEELLKFQEILIEKVLLASKSTFKKIYLNSPQKAEKKRISFRQRRVNEIFQFGKYLNKLDGSEKSTSLPNTTSPIKDLNEIHNTKDVSSPKKLFLTNDIKDDIDDIPIKSLKKGKEEEKKKNKSKKRIIQRKKTDRENKFEEKDKKKPIKGFQKEKKPTFPVSNNQTPKLTKELEWDKEIKNFKSSVKQSSKNSFDFSISKSSKSLPQKTESHQKDSDLKSSNTEPTISSKMKSPKVEKTYDAFDLLPKHQIENKKIIIHSKVVLIGASVGGPKAIKTILNDFPQNFPYPIIIIQHLNPKFVEPFSRSLDNACDIKIKVAQNNEFLKKATIYIAPGEKHMKISLKKNKPCIQTFSGPPINFCIPSIDVLFISAAQIYGNKVIGVLLTGMGEDGVKGMEFIHKKNGLTIAESKETAILYGMPKFAVKKDVVKKILPNYEIKDYLLKKAHYL
jgi:two-component system chemotaxis response regulator CheB